MTTWLYLTDMAPNARILNPATGEIRTIMPVAVKGKAPIGLRRYLLQELPGGVFQETGACVPLDVDLLADIEDAYVAPNLWNYDYPHLTTETATTPADEARIIDVLTKQMQDYPYDFEIVGLQRRFLMYFSDGNYESQKRFERLIPRPDSSPFRRDDALRRRYDWVWNSNMRDAKVPYPKAQAQLYGGLVPCLYMGPAWTVRFRLDGQDVLLERCRVYVDDAGTFLCSDWCQRHDFSSYGHGINLQMGIYSFGSWVTGPCLQYNLNQGSFAPKHATIERAAMRDALKMHVLVPSFSDALTKATKAVAKAAKPLVAAPDAGPITKDAMAEAIQLAQAVFEAPRPLATAPDDAPPPRPATTSWAPAEALHDGRLLATITTGGEERTVAYWPSRDDPYAINVLLMPTDWRKRVGTTHLDDVTIEDGFLHERFSINTASSTGFTYLGSYEDEELEQGWWLYSSACHWRDVILPTLPTLTPQET